MKIIDFIKNIDKKIYNRFSEIIDSKDDKPQKNLYLLFRISIVSIFFITLFNFIFNTTEKLGEWGDFFGGVLNPILTFLTFMGLLITIILQQKELREARHEFKGQKDALVNQQLEMVKQTFDNKFFQMLSSLNELINYLESEGKYGNDLVKGRAVFSVFRKLLVSEIFAEGDDRNHKKISNIDIKEVEKIMRIYEKTTHYSAVKYYLINLYQIISYIDREIPKDSDPKKYTNILRATLTKNELVILLFNSYRLTDSCGNNFKEYLEKYEFFEHMDYDNLFLENESLLKSEYLNRIMLLLINNMDKRAYGKNNEILLKMTENKS